MDQNLNSQTEEIIEGKQDNFSWKRILKILLAVLIIAGLGFGVFKVATARATKIWYANMFLGEKEHYLDCYGLPFYGQVVNAMQKHPEIIEQVKSTGATITDVRIECKQWDEGMTFAKGDFLISYTEKKQKAEIEKLFGKDIYGIAYRIEPAK